ncbi:MAG: hypothetical protein ACP5E4_00215, partial [Candidatus Aenigmatarchaeota archaeon]
MSVSEKKGQASLEMVVGLIILLVVAGVIIALVMRTIGGGGVEEMARGDFARKYVDSCNGYCDSENYLKYCTATFKDEFSTVDWDGDKKEGRLVRDRGGVWDFCEDRVYCFLVTDCPAMDIDGCRQYLCQTYEKKYKDKGRASQELREIYKITELASSGTCYREDKRGSKTYVSSLAPEDNWLLSNFANRGWCGGASDVTLENCGDGICDYQFYGENTQNCPTDCYCGDGVCDDTETASSCDTDCGGMVIDLLTLGNCSYDSAAATLTCDTNCVNAGDII